MLAARNTESNANLRVMQMQLGYRPHPRRPPARPGPLEVEAADAAVDVEDLAAEVEAFAETRFHRIQINLLQRHAAGGNLGVVEAAVANHGKREVDDVANDAAALVFRPAAERRIRGQSGHQTVG